MQVVISLAILGGSVVVFVGLGQSEKPAEKGETSAAVPLVEAATVAVHHSGIDFEADGVVVPFQEVSLSAEVDGRIAYRAPECRIGQVVKQGNLLLKIADTDYQLKVQQLDHQLHQAEANLQELTVQIDAAKGQIALAEVNVEIKSREIRRFEAIKTNGAISKAEIDSAKLNEHNAMTELQSRRDSLELLLSQKVRLENACKLASLECEQARLDLSRTEIRAPIDGVITQDPVVQDSFVNRGEVVVVIQDSSQMEVRCSIRMNEMEWLWQSTLSDPNSTQLTASYQFPETPATVVYETESARYEWPAALRFFDGGKLSEVTRLVPCRVTVDADAKPNVIAKRPLTIPPTLMSGMFVKVVIHADPKIPLLRLPKSAVKPNGYVWVIRDQKLHELPINVANASESEVIAYQDKEGIVAEDLVVTSPLIAPAENSEVAIAEQAL
ncbi:HlyD family efflux transporter periplasmic adaptor subunit [Blastopirellula sp. JC732]|uniref:HlyD family efflux transporter periplasmic adaptor subunit n=1 Tax=Blastopirellula sediminis TaxID=2894196 RepID=A0A9X1SHU6_9BACT|nr:HlyD family efflux transporter periplasmic adaptor subunit [Blastopirellula sediminis]MCC9606210.1 HlyD family efflux transporter periplasmic adaptor subunit [Blastopirellula sediminis]MCC9630492.1 HlyD family efflux transporter periplasmic adaptor subunit [Blastopirellula sediminis]